MSDAVRILVGDVRETLKQLPDESVHCVVTSPPFWKLRDYGVDGQLGLEETPEAWVKALVDVFREVRRVLRSDGTVWVEVGDVYSGGGRGGNPDSSPHTKQRSNVGSLTIRSRRTRAGGVKTKDLIGAPWMLAFGLRADGWWLRGEQIWNKPTAMPESVTDRPSRSHSTVFLFTKRKRYFYDAYAVRRSDRGTDHPRTLVGPMDRGNATPDRGIRSPRGRNGVGANLRSVWTIASKPYHGAHFAVFPPDLAEICIRAGSSERGCCASCGAPWRRHTDVVGSVTTGGSKRKHAAARDRQGVSGALVTGAWRVRETTGWAPSCACGDGAAPVPCTVLDIFGGTFTTAAVAITLGRSAIVCELNPDYVEMGRQRLGLFAPKAVVAG